MVSTHPWGETKEGVVMKGFVQDIEGIAVRNDEFRWVLYTISRQLVKLSKRRSWVAPQFSVTATEQCNFYVRR
jgi:hypothetical protein